MKRQIKRIITDHGNLLRIFINYRGDKIHVYEHKYDPDMTKIMKEHYAEIKGTLVATYDYPKYSLRSIFRIFSIDQEPYDYE